MKIAPTGLPYIGIGLALAGILLAFTKSWAAAGVGFFLAAFSVFFFRDPERPLTPDADAAFSPADGVVMSVETEEPGTKRLRIFLSVADVHVQRAPLGGRVVASDYQKGKFVYAKADEAKVNERNILTVESGEVTWKMEQIAGFVARRIKTYVKPGDTFAQGDRLGIIHFGSQVSLQLPESWEFAVKPGERVVGNVTVVARRVASRTAGAGASSGRAAK